MLAAINEKIPTRQDKNTCTRITCRSYYSGVPGLRASLLRENGLKKNGKFDLARKLEHRGFARLFPRYELLRSSSKHYIPI